MSYPEWPELKSPSSEGHYCDYPQALRLGWAGLCWVVGAQEATPVRYPLCMVRQILHRDGLCLCSFHAYAPPPSPSTPLGSLSPHPHL